MAGNHTDIIIHAAAIKNLEISEFNPIETIETNINGTVNMIKMAMNTKPKKFINISTDKAAEPATLYGTTKQIGERLTSWTGLHDFDTKFCSVRFGNIFESQGNVFEVWNEEKEKNQPLSITDPRMKRYLFHIDEAVNFILNCLTISKGGEIFVPKMKSYPIKSLASKVSKNHKIIGLRPGEKINEILLTRAEKSKAKELPNMWIIKNT
jgi:UDP-N-acetylglucosamine 4,6-dehydratase